MPGAPATTQQLAEFCRVHCDHKVQCGASEFADARACVDSCENRYGPDTVRGDYIELVSACEDALTCRDFADEDGFERCQEQTRAVVPATSAGKTFCAAHAEALTACEVFDEELSCSDWTKHVADAAFPRLAKCTQDDASCSQVLACMLDVLVPGDARDDDNAADGGASDDNDGGSYDPCADEGAYGCPDYDPCLDDPQSSASCPDYDPCLDDPQSSASCPDYDFCVDDPQSDPSCPGYDVCQDDPQSTSSCPGYDVCQDDPQSDPSCPGYDFCVDDPQSDPSCPGYDFCVDDPQSGPSCPGYDVCQDDPQVDPSCAGYDPCVADPSSC